MAGVNLESVSRAYPGGVLAVDQVSLEVRDREFLVLVGPSGCGKTTTLRLIAGLEELTAGNITIGTRLVNDVAAKDRDVAMVFQNYALYPHMTVYRNMAFGLELREGVGGVGRLWRWALSAEKKRASAQRRYSIAERVHNAARILGIEPLLDRYPRQLSGGERQRVALGRAIVRNPAVFLFDEPLSNLDAKLRVEMRRELKQLHQRLATTMVYVTHDQVEALTLGDRIVVMEGGKIQQVGPPMEVYDRPANRFVASFIGTPGMNFIEGHIALENQNWIFRRGDLKVSLAECGLKRPTKTIEPQAATLGVRPEHLRVFVEPTPGSHPGVVEVVEMLGDATVATVRLQIAEGGLADGHLTHNPNGVNVISKADARADLEAGTRVWVQADESRLHVFSEESGRNLIDRTPPIVAN